ncbi:MAG: glutaredoxin family protein [Thaumarchaeota archaeon]|nr:glutaredoxin family protein [Nitrososphaerota archaeon]
MKASGVIPSMRKSVTVVSKQGCHLCEKVVEALNSLSSRYELEVKVVDIANDAGLNEKYLLDIPVVQIDGRDVFDAKDMVKNTDYATLLERAVSRNRSSL